MSYKNKYIKYKYKYLDLLNNNKNMIGGDKTNNILFIFFNGGGADKNMWFEFQGKKTNILNKIEKIGKIYLYNPLTTLTNEKINEFKNSDSLYIFTLSDVNITNHCKNLYDNVSKISNKFFLISHSRGYMFASVFSKLYNKNIIGFINIDGGKPKCEYEEYLKINKNKYDNITNDYILSLQLELKKSNKEQAKQIEKELSNVVEYFTFKQYKKTIWKYNFPVYILNNIYDDSEINICMDDYVKTTLKNKFDYNKQLELNINVKSIWYVGKKHWLFVFEEIENDIIDIIKKIIYV